MLSGTAYVNWFLGFMHKILIFQYLCKFCFEFNFFKTWYWQTEDSGELKWFKLIRLGFLDTILNTWTGTEHQSQISHHIPFKNPPFSDRDKKNSNLPVHCQWICSVKSDLFLFLFEFTPWKNSGRWKLCSASATCLQKWDMSRKLIW